MLEVTTITAESTVPRRGPLARWLMRAVYLVVGVLAVALALLLIVPLLVLGVCALVGFAIVTVLRAKVGRADGDGRENVRVVRRDGDSE